MRSLMSFPKKLIDPTRPLNGRHQVRAVNRSDVSGRFAPGDGEAGDGEARFLKNSFGVTLVEIMAALVIFGILITLSVPAFRKYMATQQVEGSVHRMAANLRLARQSAAAERNSYKIRFDFTGKQYSILDDDNDNGTADTGEKVLGPVNIPAELTVTNGPGAPFSGDTLVFYPDGSTSSTGTVTFENRKHYSRLVRVMRSTGTVAVR